MTGVLLVSDGCRGQGEKGVVVGKGGEEERSNNDHQHQQLSLMALLLTAVRKSMVPCSIYSKEEVISAVHQQMDIGSPTDVEHITHVTFDRFNGFLGLPIEFEVEIPTRVPSASASVFGVSPESMQCCYDAKGNSVPTILLLMQEKLYTQGGLKAEGIFRINPENSKEEFLREQLNKGIVPDDIDVHCLASLIKTWFRELPSGVLDELSPEHVLRSNGEEECVELVRQLRPTPAGLLNWAVELMADVVEEEEFNKMNARNIAMVFAPNMTQMADPLTALMHAVQVMNLLKTLIHKCLMEREDAEMEEAALSFSISPASRQYTEEEEEEEEEEEGFSDESCELVEQELSEEEEQADELMEKVVEVCQGSYREEEAWRMGEIEDCFLRQLELEEEEQAEASECDDGENGNSVAQQVLLPNLNTKSQSMKEGSLRVADEVYTRGSLSDGEGMRCVSSTNQIYCNDG